MSNVLTDTTGQLAWGPLKSLKVTLEDVQAIVANNDKQRFSLKAKAETNPSSGATTSASTCDYLIRANQGHSIKVESSSLLEPITLAAGNVPPRVLHGTYFAFWPAIIASGGLRPMGRNHVHCSAGEPGGGGVVSGMRGDAELVVEIDVEASLREGSGVTWWRSDNGVVLTEGGEDGVVGTRFFKRVTGRKVDVGSAVGGWREEGKSAIGYQGEDSTGQGPPRRRWRASWKG